MEPTLSDLSAATTSQEPATLSAQDQVCEGVLASARDLGLSLTVPTGLVAAVHQERAWGPLWYEEMTEHSGARAEPGAGGPGVEQRA
jgi:hypothetical protein